MTASGFHEINDGGMIFCLQVDGLAQISVSPFSRYTMDN